MKIGIIGLGYIGSVMAAGLCNENEIFIFDIDKKKLKLVEERLYDFPETDVANAIKTANAHVSISLQDLIASNCELLLVCLPTPLIDGNLALGAVMETLRGISEIGYNGTVCIRSTLSLDERVIRDLECLNLDICVVPEFLREGSALKDFRTTEVLIIGTTKQTSKASLNKLTAVFGPHSRNIKFMSIQAAILTKLINNAWHATKVAFANEWGRIANDLCKGNEDIIYDAFIADKKLNCSSAYLKPGGPFGGPCLIKDTTDLVSLQNVKQPSLLEGVLKSNDQHIEDLATQVINICLKRDVKFFRFDSYEFKTGTGDIRNSPIVLVQEKVLRLSKLCVVEKQKNPAHKKYIVLSGKSLIQNGKIKLVEEYE